MNGKKASSVRRRSVGDPAIAGRKAGDPGASADDRSGADLQDRRVHLPFELPGLGERDPGRGGDLAARLSLQVDALGLHVGLDAPTASDTESATKGDGAVHGPADDHRAI